MAVFVSFYLSVCSVDLNKEKLDLSNENVLNTCRCCLLKLFIPNSNMASKTALFMR